MIEIYAMSLLIGIAIGLVLAVPAMILLAGVYTTRKTRVPR